MKLTLTYDRMIKKVIDIMTIDDMNYLFGNNYFNFSFVLNC